MEQPKEWTKNWNDIYAVIQPIFKGIETLSYLSFI